MKVVLLVAALVCSTTVVGAQQVVTVGVLTDMSSLYKDNSGAGSVEAARMAVEDFDPESHQMQVRVVSADHQNKADIGAAIARKWFDVDNVDMIVDVPNSSIAFAVSEVARTKNRALFVSNAGSSELTGVACSPNTVHFTYDTWALSKIAARALVNEGKKNWFFITADYSFGHALERDASAVVAESGGKVVGAVRAPINSSDFSSFVVQAQAANADVVAFANSGADLVNSMKQAAEFGLGSRKEKLAGLLVFITDVKSLSLNAAGGLSYADAFYWDFDEDTRNWSKRFAARTNGAVPTMGHAGVYSSVLAFLRSAGDLKQARDGAAVIRNLRDKSWKDPLFGETQVRADGRALHRMLFVETKVPAESKGPNDLLKVKQVISAADAFRPMSDGKCLLAN
ncbi:ABC transporter substrate-binding protein [Bradyrhizobium sp. USDA 3256]